ncbi:MAG: hypothetical protein JNL30_00510 [Rubrivivax sp.]|nr:hypothetical protein [Rubrivivax sp.]
MTPPATAQTIFISIAAYCDPMLAFTIASARSQARDPSRVFIGVVEQQVVGQQLRLTDEWSRQHVRFTRIDALEARGPCWARSLAMALYQSEDWYLQIDSHMWFEPGWDDRLVEWGQWCESQNSRSLISCYPNPFEMINGHPVAKPVTNNVLAFAVQGSAEFDKEHPVLMFECVAVDRTEPVLGFHVGGGCLFAPGYIVEDLPYDPRLYFHGEEQAFALRAWTHGWDIYQIPGMPIYHLYTQPGTTPRPMHWTPEQDERRATRSAALEKAAQLRLAAMLWADADLGAYGLGRARTLAEFAEFSGIDYVRRTIAPNARKQRWGY